MNIVVEEPDFAKLPLDGSLHASALIQIDLFFPKSTEAADLE